MVDRIDRDLVASGMVSETDLHRYTAFASDLGLRPGQWPERIPTTLGNGLAFCDPHQETRGDDLLAVTYRQANGCISLRVFND